MANTATNTTDAVNKTSVNVSVLAKKRYYFHFFASFKIWILNTKAVFNTCNALVRKKRYRGSSLNLYTLKILSL